jgi:hypothetical protein
MIKALLGVAAVLALAVVFFVVFLASARAGSREDDR